MDTKPKVINRNLPHGQDSCITRNYQLIRNDIIELESDTHLTCYSIMINSLKNNTVTDSEYINDVSRNEQEAKRIFEKVAVSDIPQEVLEEMLAEIL
ncbi:MAG: hypothetical protein E7588_04525 [Ruminococcaceae bacterium]|nr:hypothetical protein [Oscillospiraceae bacterium]